MRRQAPKKAALTAGIGLENVDKEKESNDRKQG